MLIDYNVIANIYDPISIVDRIVFRNVFDQMYIFYVFGKVVDQIDMYLYLGTYLTKYIFVPFTSGLPDYAAL